LTVGPWPSGPAWFLWVLLALDAIAALIWAIAPGAIKALGKPVYALRYRPGVAFALFMIFSVAVYLPMHLGFRDSSWLEPDGFPLPIQTSRILLYAGYFFFGVGIGASDLRAGLLAENSELAARWNWLGFALAFYGAILFLVYVHHNRVDFNAPPLWWRADYGLAFALFSAAMAFAEPAFFLRFANTPMRLLDAMRPSAYGIYLVHYIFIIYLQYAVFAPAWPAFV